MRHFEAFHYLGFLSVSPNHPLQSLTGAEGISCAGHQGGLGDGRSALLAHIFRIYDSLENP